MILAPGHTSKYLHDYLDGKIKPGLGISMPGLDKYLLFKDNQFNLVLGHDNVGKTDFILWYFLCLSSWHDLTWTIWAGENSAGQAMRKLIQWYSGRYFMDLTHEEVRMYEARISQWFQFVDNKKLYNPDELLGIFARCETDGYLIDPFTGLDRAFTHEGNYKFMNEVRQFVNQEKRSLYLVTHPNTESGRAGRIYPKDDEYAGHLMPPLKDHVEGGKPFVNRADDVIIVHRLVKHPGNMKFLTWIDVAKLKNKDTGGNTTPLLSPVMLDWNSGLGYTLGGHNGIKREDLKRSMSPSLDFE